LGKTRSIRLKEYDPNVNRELVLREDFVEKSDDTLQAGPFTLRTDAHGFIITGNTVPENATPIAVIGGSFVESSWVHEDKRFVAQAERMMPGYRLLNGGYSGSTTLQLYNVMLSKIYPIIGDGGTLVFFVGQSDSDVINREGSYWTDARMWSPIVPAFQPDITVPTGVIQIRRMVDIVIETAKTLNINLILASSPYRVGDFSDDAVLRKRFRRDRAAFEAKMAEQDAIREATIEVGLGHSIDVIDFQTLTEGNPDWFYDALHLNEYGQTKFSSIFTHEIKQRLDSSSH